MNDILVLMWLGVAAYGIICLGGLVVDAINLHVNVRLPLRHSIFLIFILCSFIELGIVGIALYMAAQWGG